MTQRFDAVVIGGGPAGASAAILLVRLGWSVAVVERTPFPRRKVCGEYLSATNLSLFRLLGLDDAFESQTGPEVRRVGLFAGPTMLESSLPPLRPTITWGRAWARTRLDTLLLQRAAAEGAILFQPWRVVSLQPDARGYVIAISSRDGDAHIAADLIVAAHGSWGPGPLPTQSRKPRARPDDLFAFKTYLCNSSLPDDLMPLLCFPGGYGGMVHCGEGRVSLSCCVRRDWLKRIRLDASANAGTELLAHIRNSCIGVKRVLDSARSEGAWLAAGPIRPGIRLQQRDRMFSIGNVAGEAHPVIAEGISMAMQSAWLLAGRLHEWKRHGGDPLTLPLVQKAYARTWRRAFAPRLHAARVVAHWAMRPAAVAASLPILRYWPGLLTLGARLSGKCSRIDALV